MQVTERSDRAFLRMSVCEGTQPEQLTAAAALIQRLPGVLRVGGNLAAGQLEILVRYPAAGLLREIHGVLRAIHAEIAALKVH